MYDTLHGFESWSNLLLTSIHIYTAYTIFHAWLFILKLIQIFTLHSEVRINLILFILKLESNLNWCNNQLSCTDFSTKKKNPKHITRIKFCWNVKISLNFNSIIFWLKSVHKLFTKSFIHLSSQVYTFIQLSYNNVYQFYNKCPKNVLPTC